MFCDVADHQDTRDASSELVWNSKKTAGEESLVPSLSSEPLIIVINFLRDPL